METNTCGRINHILTNNILFINDWRTWYILPLFTTMIFNYDPCINNYNKPVDNTQKIKSSTIYYDIQ